MTKFTPSTEQIRSQYQNDMWDEEGGAEFDRWLRAHDAAVWSAGHGQALANLAWPNERKSNPYRDEND